MSNIKIIHDVVSDLRKLAGSIESLVQSISIDEESVNEPKKNATKAKLEKNTKKPEKQEKQPTLEEVRALMADKNRNGHREAVKAIINKYGVEKLTSLDSSYYKQVLEEVGELK